MSQKKSGARFASQDSVKSLLKAMSILEAFSMSRRSMSLAEIATSGGFPRSTAHRLAASMRELGLLDQDGQRDRYRLGVKLFELGNRALANMDLHREARPLIDELSQACGQRARPQPQERSGVRSRQDRNAPRPADRSETLDRIPDCGIRFCLTG